MFGSCSWLTASCPQEDVALWAAIADLRQGVNGTLEKARIARAIGASLDARVTLHVADPALRARLQQLDASANGADELRYLLIVSQVRLGVVLLNRMFEQGWAGVGMASAVGYGTCSLRYGCILRGWLWAGQRTGVGTWRICCVCLLIASQVRVWGGRVLKGGTTCAWVCLGCACWGITDARG